METEPHIYHESVSVVCFYEANAKIILHVEYNYC